MSAVALEKYAELFQIICDMYPLGIRKSFAQKIFYFFECKGIKLNLRYCIGRTGVYSSKLEDLEMALESEDYIRIDTSVTPFKIASGSEKVKTENLTSDEKAIVFSVLRRFGEQYPSNLEMLSYVDYIINKMLGKNADYEQIVQKVRNAKGANVNEREVADAIRILRRYNYIG